MAQRETTPMLRAPYAQNSNNLYQYTTGATPAGGAGALAKPDFTPWFGAPMREMKTNPYEGYSHENYDLPEAYLGSNPFLSKVIVQLITDDDMWITRVGLPLRQTNDQGEIMWNIWVFDNHGMTNVPEEGVSRLLSSKMLTRRGHYQRFGLAMILEHGFMNTPQGRMCYEMNLVQIKNAILETLYYGALEEYLLCKSHNQTWTRKHGSRVSTYMVDQQMQLEVRIPLMTICRSERRLFMHDCIAIHHVQVDNWACIQKNEGGWDLLDSRCKRQLQDSGHQPNMWILPRGMKPYIALDKNMTSYFLRGPDGPELAQSANNGENLQVVDRSNDCAIYESKAFQMPGEEEPLDLLWRDRSVGEYYLMQDHIPQMRYTAENPYLSAYRTIYVYDESTDRMKPITLEMALNNCERFDSKGNLKDDSQDPHGMFRCNPYPTSYGTDRSKKVEYFGEIEEEFLDDDMLDKMARVMKYKFAADESDDNVVESITQISRIFDSKKEALFNEDNIDAVFGKQTKMSEDITTTSAVLATEINKFMLTNADNPELNLSEEGKKFLKGDLYTTNLKDSLTKTTFPKLINYGAVKEEAKLEERINALTVALTDAIDLQSFMKLLVYIYGYFNNNKVNNKARAAKILGQLLTDAGKDAAEGKRTLFRAATVVVTNNNTEHFEEAYEKVSYKKKDALPEATFASKLKPDFQNLPLFQSLESLRSKKRARGPFVQALPEEEARFGARIRLDGDGADKEADAPMDFDGEYADPASYITINGNVINFGNMMRERYNKYKDGDAFNKIKQYILGLRVTKDTIQALIKNDIPLPFGFMLARPFITHNMGTAILTTAGQTVGETLVGRSDFQLTDNVVQKMHYGHFTFYARSIIYSPEKVLVVTDIISRRYIGGNDMQFFNSESLQSYRRGMIDSHKSFVTMLISATEGSIKKNPIDLTGKYHNTNSDYDYAPEPQYPDAQFYSELYHFRNASGNSNQNDYFEYYNRLNTVVYQGHQMMWDPHTKSYSRVVLNTGHWGYRVYEGVKAVRNGAMKTMREVDYNSTSGGPVPAVPLGY